jgi:predicted naringenin-chalcone synthase
VNVPVGIAAVATASPERALGQEEVADFLLAAYGDRLRPQSRAVLRKVFAHPSVRRRRMAAASLAEVAGEDPDRRVERFTRAAVELSVQAARKALLSADAAPEEVESLVVNTCTGYVCPGLSGYVAEALGLRPELRAYDLVGSGCGGAVPNLELAAGSLNGHGGAALSISVEICSATFQMGDDLSLIVSNALFADGAAAAGWPWPSRWRSAARPSRWATTCR